MITLATPDFGASAGIGLCPLFAWAVVLVFVGVGVFWGVRLVRGQSSKSRAFGVLLVVVSALIPFACCLGPPHVVRVVYGNYPLGSYPSGKIKEGMSADEVVAILGTPHERYKEGDGEHWYYWLDSFDMNYFGVQFGPDGRVVSTHGN